MSSTSVPSQSAKHSSNQMSYPVDPDSPLFVAKAIISSAALGAATGGVLGTVRAGNPFAFAINMGINGGVFSLTFFGLREYLISPLLLTAAPTSSHVSRLSYLSAKQLGKLPASPYTPSLSEVRTDRLLDSSISGFLTGSILSGSLRGVRTVVPAGITAGLVAGLLQYSVNEIRVVRLQLLARQSGGAALSVAGSEPGTQSAQATALGTDSQSSTEIPAAPTIQAFTEPFKHDPSTQTLPARMMAGLSKFLPVRKLSDDEYMQTLKKREGEIAKRLAEIQVEELRFYEASLGANGGDEPKEA